MHPNEPPRLSLANLPTPVVNLPRLAKHLDVPRLLIKRDDLTGLETTGNKIRKLEYVVADAIAVGADTLVTHGGFQSNHCRATAAVGARLGLHVRLLLRSPTPTPDLDGNLFLDHLFNAEISYHAPEEYHTNRKQLIDAAMNAQRAAGRRPYFFPVGASVPHGVWGYVRCLAELASQLDPNTPVDLYSAVSSAGTHAGLMVGKHLLGLRHWRVVGIPVSDSLPYFQSELNTLVAATSAQFNLNLPPLPIDLLDGFIGDGYALPTPSAIDATRLLARTEGILLDPTYTSKAFAGFLHALQTKAVRTDATPLFLHTGGLFGLMARRDLFP